MQPTLNNIDGFLSKEKPSVCTTRSAVASVLLSRQGKYMRTACSAGGRSWTLFNWQVESAEQLQAAGLQNILWLIGFLALFQRFAPIEKHPAGDVWLGGDDEIFPVKRQNNSVVPFPQSRSVCRPQAG